MGKLIINSKGTLLKITDYMHDSGFKVENIIYNRDTKIFRIKTKEYEYRGHFISRKTNIVKQEYELILEDVEECDIVEKDRKGYNAVEEDYFNFIKVNKEGIIIKTTFHEIRLKVSKIKGVLLFI